MFFNGLKSPPYFSFISYDNFCGLDIFKAFILWNILRVKILRQAIFRNIAVTKWEAIKKMQ